MNRLEVIREGIKEIFSEDMLLCFWTHEKCPPNVNSYFKKCQLDKDIKHEACMPCWEEWVDDLVEQVIQKLHSQGIVIKVDRELPSIFDSDENILSALEYKKKLAGYVAVELLIKEGEK